VNLSGMYNKLNWYDYVVLCVGYNRLYAPFHLRVVGIVSISERQSNSDHRIMLQARDFWNTLDCMLKVKIPALSQCYVALSLYDQLNAMGWYVNPVGQLNVDHTTHDVMFIERDGKLIGICFGKDHQYLAHLYTIVRTRCMSDNVVRANFMEHAFAIDPMKAAEAYGSHRFEQRRGRANSLT